MNLTSRLLTFELCSDVAMHLVEAPMKQVLRRQSPYIVFTGQLGHIHHPSAQNLLRLACQYYQTVFLMPKLPISLHMEGPVGSLFRQCSNIAVINPNVCYDCPECPYSLINDTFSIDVEDHLHASGRQALLAHHGSSFTAFSSYKRSSLLAAVLIPYQYPLYSTHMKVDSTLYVSANPLQSMKPNCVFLE